MRPILSTLLATLGLIALAASFAAPHLDDGRSAWTDEKAEQFSQATRELHASSFARATAENEKKLVQAQADYRALEQELRQAQQRGNRTGWWLRGAAFVLLVTALFVHRGS